MTTIRTIHVIDCHSQRRQSVARVLFNMGLHAEPYECPDEFLDRTPTAGFAFVEASDKQLDRALNLFDEAGVRLPVIGYSEMPTAMAIVQAVHFGASGYLAWPFDMVQVFEVLTMVGSVHRFDETCAASGRAPQPADQPGARTLMARLSNRERQVLDQILDARTSREIAEILQISPRTVEIHRHNLMRKLEARKVTDAVRIAIEAKRQADSIGRAATLRGFGYRSLAPNSKVA